MTMNNSLTISSEEVEAKLSAGTPYVVRLKVPRKEKAVLQDIQ